MKSQRIPENKLNGTKTVGQILESFGNNQFFNIDTAKRQSKQVHSNEGEEGEGL